MGGRPPTPRRLDDAVDHGGVPRRHPTGARLAGAIFVPAFLCACLASAAPSGRRLPEEIRPNSVDKPLPPGTRESAELPPQESPPTGRAASDPAPAIPFLTEEAPLRSLAIAFGFRTSGSLRTGRVRILSRRHEIVIAPGIARALIDGRGVPLLGAPRFVGGQLVVPPELADIIRRMGARESSGRGPSSFRPRPRKKPKIAFLPAGADRTALVLAAGPGDSEVAGPARPRRGRSRGAAGRAGGKVRGVVLIDAGHGGKDEGARGPRGVKEKDVVLLIAKRLAEELRREGVRAELTRADDSFASLSSRAASANRLKADLLVSIHVNSYPQAHVRGVETWVAAKRLARSKQAAEKSRALAESVQAALVRATGERDRGVRASRFAVLRKSKVPAVLVEAGFISNPKTEKKLVDPAYHRKVAEALTGAIMESGLLQERSPSPKERSPVRAPVRVAGSR